MSNNILIVVGNKFAKFATCNNKIITLDELKAMSQVDLLGSYDVHLGQGVMPKEFFDIESSMDNTKKRTLNFIHSSKLNDLLSESNLRSVHKQRSENVMISPPSQLSDNHFVSDFQIQDTCAELGDHMTGQHIQGMALVEAARQMMLSVSENYLLAPELVGKSYCVLNDIQIKFERFAFPLPTEIHYELSSVKVQGNGTLNGIGRASFIQNGTSVTQVTITFSHYSQAFICQKEDGLARKAVLDSMKNIYLNNVRQLDARQGI
jgi:hypothetical protein